MSSNAASVRNVNKDTVIGYKHLRKGNRISMFYTNPLNGIILYLTRYK